jgi:hypothetical protein
MSTWHIAGAVEFIEDSSLQCYHMGYVAYA